MYMDKQLQTNTYYNDAEIRNTNWYTISVELQTKSHTTNNKNKEQTHSSSKKKTKNLIN